MEQGNNNYSNPSGRSVFLKGCAIGCAVLMLAAAVIVYIFYVKYQEASAAAQDIAQDVAKDLQGNGFSALDEDITGKSIMDLFVMLNSPRKITTPPAGKLYGIGGELVIDAECAHDILFVGARCVINKPVKAGVCFIGIGDQNVEVKVAPGVKVDRLFTNPGVKVDNQGEIPGGVQNDFRDFYDFTALQKTIMEKHGDTITDILKGVSARANTGKRHHHDD